MGKKTEGNGLCHKAKLRGSNFSKFEGLYTPTVLENILRNRAVAFGLKRSSLGFIYLFDGLDELDEERADRVLSFIATLENQLSTKKIIISCRSGNANRLRVKLI